MKKLIIIAIAMVISLGTVNAQQTTKEKCNKECKKDEKSKADCKAGKCDVACKKSGDKKTCCAKKAA